MRGAGFSGTVRGLMTHDPDPAQPPHRDVRSRGFAARADVEEVERFLAAHSTALSPESVPLLECAGRVLAEDVRAGVSVPSFARSAMDGFALRGEDSFGASDYDPIRLKLLGQALPGRPFGGRVGAGEAIRIMTGAPLPEGADAVAMAEVCREEAGLVALTEPVAPHKHVGAIGEDIRAGETVLRAGRRLRAQDAGLRAERRAHRRQQLGGAARARRARRRRDARLRAAAGSPRRDPPRARGQRRRHHPALGRQLGRRRGPRAGPGRRARHARLPRRRDASVEPDWRRPTSATR
jgi:hypothetical protein